MDRAAEEGLPVFATGEETGVIFYEKVLSFRRVPKTEYWLDSEAREVSRDEVKIGNDAWKKINEGLSGCEVFWCPEGVTVDCDG
jgi:hypothetical protein